MRHRILTLLMASLALVSFGCANESAIRIEADGPISYDGLRRLHKNNLDEAWARPGLDLTRYRKVLLQPIEVSFREVRPRSTLRSRASTQSNFPVGEEAKAKLQSIVENTFKEQLSRSDRYGLTSEPGRDVLLIRASLLDVVSHVPPEPIGRSDIYLRSIGEATLVLELRDGVSNEILARAIDRCAADRTDLFIELSTVTAWSEVRIVAKSWAKLLRRRLDEFIQLGA